MLSFGTVPDPTTALDQTPANPNPLQRLRLAEALYYASKHYTDCDGWNPCTFDQLYGEHCLRYYALADYLLARRERPTARPVPVSAFESRLFATLDTVLTDYSYYLVEPGEHTLSEPRIAEWLLDHYAFSAERAQELAGRWAEMTRPRLANGELTKMPF
jgi:hypothetical protein